MKSIRAFLLILVGALASIAFAQGLGRALKDGLAQGAQNAKGDLAQQKRCQKSPQAKECVERRARERAQAKETYDAAVKAGYTKSEEESADEVAERVQRNLDASEKLLTDENIKKYKRVQKKAREARSEQQ